ncbi:MAG: hypothetical protein E6J34_23315, partial [Chloroflexi bacterium]
MSGITTGQGQASTLPNLLAEHNTEIIYCQGVAQLLAEHDRASAISLHLDLPTVQARCLQQISATACYQRYRELSLNYGPAFQAIEQLSIGEGDVLARLRLPVVPLQTQTQGDKPLPYVLHPAMLDAALHASIGLLIEQNAQLQLQVPFALAELLIINELPTQGWAWVRRRQGHTAELKLDIEICDDEGRVAARLLGLSTRPLATSSPSVQTLLLTPDWQEETVPEREPASLSHTADQVAHLTQPLVLLCDLPHITASRMQAQMASGGRCRSLHSSQVRREHRFQEVVLQLIQELRELRQSPPLEASSTTKAPMLVQIVVAQREEPSLLQALVGVLKVAQQEDLTLRGQLIEVQGQAQETDLLAWLRENQLRPHEQHIRYQAGKRYVRAWQEHPEVSVSPDIPWKEGGCYL